MEGAPQASVGAVVRGRGTLNGLFVGEVVVGKSAFALHESLGLVMFAVGKVPGLLEYQGWSCLETSSMLVTSFPCRVQPLCDCGPLKQLML